MSPLALIIIAFGLLLCLAVWLRHMCVQDQCHTPRIPWDDE